MTIRGHKGCVCVSKDFPGIATLTQRGLDDYLPHMAFFAEFQLLDDTSYLKFPG